MSLSIGPLPLICQCLSLLPVKEFECPLLNYGKKLSTASLIKIMITAHLDNLNSYTQIEEKLRAEPKLREYLDVSEISGSQLSRRVNDLPTEWVQKLFLNVVKLFDLSDISGLHEKIGPLAIVDSTEIKLPHGLAPWASISEGHTAIKAHTRLLVPEPYLAFPDKMVPSLGKVADVETGILMTDGLTAKETLLADRAYGSKDNLMEWQERELSFVVRIKKNLRLYTQEVLEPTHPRVIRNETVLYGISEEPLRYVEFTDEKDRVYRILSSRFDLSDQEIMAAYKYRWLIELFFKWIKGHLRVKKTWSTKPQGIWNQLFLAFIAYLLIVLVKQKVESKKSPGDFLQAIRCYWYKPVKEFLTSFYRKKKKSKGRQAVEPRSSPTAVDIGNIALDKDSIPKKKKQTKPKSKTVSERNS